MSSSQQSTPGSMSRKTNRELLRAHYGGGGSEHNTSSASSPSSSPKPSSSPSHGHSSPNIAKINVTADTSGSGNGYGLSRKSPQSASQTLTPTKRKPRSRSDINQATSSPISTKTIVGSRVDGRNIAAGNGVDFAGATSAGNVDIDSPDFSPRAYYDHVLATNSLSQLVKASTVLTNDVHNLNASRHTLVYNHHHQLFTANKTIATLNQNMPELEGIMQGLQNNFDDISKVVEGLEDKGSAVGM